GGGAAPLTPGAPADTFAGGGAGSFTSGAGGSPPPTTTRGGASLSPDILFTNNGDGTATLSGTPASNTGGVRNLTFTANNNAGASPIQQFALTIREAPAITSPPRAAFEIGATSSLTITASGYPTPTLTRLGPLPGGMTFVDNGDGTGTLSGTPGGPGNAYPLTFGATNSAGSSAPQSFTLVVGQAPA